MESSTTTMPTPASWHDKVMQQFRIIPANALESDFHGVYSKLLHFLFPPDSDYSILSLYLKHGPSKRVMTFEVSFNSCPVLILELKDPGDLHSDSARRLADLQIRQRIVDQRAQCHLPTIHAISALGTRLCFYSLETSKEEADILPLAVEPHSTRVTNIAPKGRWNLDITTAEGEHKLRAVVEEIKQGRKRRAEEE